MEGDGETNLLAGAEQGQQLGIVEGQSAGELAEADEAGRALTSVLNAVRYDLSSF